MSTKKLLLVGVALVFLLVLGFLWTHYIATLYIPTQESTLVNPLPPHPELTSDRTIDAIGDTSFAALVSYTDAGFEPKQVTVRQGDMIRFTNNSTVPMWIIADSVPTQAPHAADPSVCATGTLNTCKELPPGEYWEFTFNTAGDWSFHENTHRSATGVVHVQ